MEELIKFNQTLKEQDLDTLLNKLVSYSQESEYLKTKREELKKICDDKIFLIKMEISERFISKS